MGDGNLTGRTRGLGNSTLRELCSEQTAIVVAGIFALASPIIIAIDSKLVTLRLNRNK